jgi:predicted Rossmann-fold nucleotide-binding protein
MHFAARATEMVACPFGFGTMEALFELLTLVQAGKMARIPIVLVGTGFWQRAIDFGFLAQEGTVTRDDLDHFTLVETAKEAVDALEGLYDGRPPA